jgi:hypothetical protein
MLLPACIAHFAGVGCRQESCTENGALEKAVNDDLTITASKKFAREYFQRVTSGVREFAEQRATHNQKRRQLAAKRLRLRRWRNAKAAKRG